jgi:predicted kinase
MALIVALIGHISAGKTSVATALAGLLDATHISSDHLEQSIAGHTRPLSTTSIYETEQTSQHAFTELGKILERIRATGGNAILDSTGMHPTFQATLRRHRDVTSVVLLHCNYDTWQKREFTRTDRPPLDETLRTASHTGAESLEPDLRLDTTDRDPDALATIIYNWLRQRHAPTT